MNSMGSSESGQSMQVKGVMERPRWQQWLLGERKGQGEESRESPSCSPVVPASQQVSAGIRWPLLSSLPAFPRRPTSWASRGLGR